jgi:5-methyltetrahydrofolate--homocysteine methyltransferase
MNEYKELHDAILRGDSAAARAVADRAVAAGADPLALIQEYMMPAMSEVGRRFECNDYFVPELLLAARAMKSALEPIRPLLSAKNARGAGRVLIGTVAGDLHDIGKNLVIALLEGAGYEVKDLGVNVAPALFVRKIGEVKPDIVAMSALLTTTMPAMKLTIEAIAKAGLRDQVKIIIGGAPISQRYADEIGADGYGESASAAVTLASRVLGKVAGN